MDAPRNPFAKHTCTLNLSPEVVSVVPAPARSDEATDPGFPTETIYSYKYMWLCFALGGPLGGGYMIAANFYTFNDQKRAGWTWFVTIFATIFAIAYAISVGSIPGLNAINGISAGIAYSLMRYYQGKRIDAHIRAGGATHDLPRIIGLAFVGLIIVTLPIIMGLETQDDRRIRFDFPVSVVEPPPPALASEGLTVKTYGTLKHEVYFLESNISDKEIDKLIAGMTKIEFFTVPPRTVIKVEKQIKSYELFILCNSRIKTDPSLYERFDRIRKELQKYFPRNKIVFNLAIDRFNNVSVRVE